MKYRIVLGCVIGAISCEMDRGSSNKSMVSRLAQIKMLLSSALGEGVMKESSNLSKTLKKFSTSYIPKKESRLIKIEKEGDITEKTILTDHKDIVEDELPGIHSKVTIHHAKRKPVFSDEDDEYSSNRTHRAARRPADPALDQPVYSDYERRRSSSKKAHRSNRPSDESDEADEPISYSEYERANNRADNRADNRANKRKGTRRNKKARKEEESDYESTYQNIPDYSSDGSGYREAPSRFISPRGGHKYGRKSQQKPHPYDTSYNDSIFS